MPSGSVADLLPVLDVEERHFVTTDGRVGCLLACSGVNLAIASDTAASSASDLFAAALAYLPTAVHGQLLVLNTPLRAEEWVPRHLAQYHPPPGLAHYVALLDEAYGEALAGQHVPDLRFYAALSAPGAPPLRTRGIPGRRTKEPYTRAGCTRRGGGSPPRHGERVRPRPRRTGDHHHPGGPTRHP